MASMHSRAQGPCCALVRLVEGSMRHKALVRAILQVTGYRKPHVKQAGLVVPRENGEFTLAFHRLVEQFLENRGCGSIFFPEKVPDYEGWEDSWMPGERYKWVHGKLRGGPSGMPTAGDRERIREAVELMFENLRDHDTTLDLGNTITLQSCLTDHCCEICAGNKTAEDDIVVCENCHVVRHLSCYKLPNMPNKPYYCRACTASRERQSDEVPKQSNKRAAKSESFIVDEERFGSVVGSAKDTRSTRSNPAGAYQPIPLMVSRKRRSDEVPEQSDKRAAKSESFIVDDEESFDSAVRSAKDTRSTRSNPVGAYQPIPRSRSKDTRSPNINRHVSASASRGRSIRATHRRGSVQRVSGNSGSSTRNFAPVSPSKDDVLASSPVRSTPVVQASTRNVPADLGSAHSSQALFLTPAMSDRQSDAPSTPGDIRADTPSPEGRCVPELAESTLTFDDIEMDNTVGMPVPYKQIESNAQRKYASIEKEKHRETEILDPHPPAEPTDLYVPNSSSNIQILSQAQINHTKLRIRLGAKSMIYRTIDLSRIDALSGLFAACVNRWEDRLKGQTPRIAAYLPTDLKGVTEFTADTDVAEFLKLIKAEWDKAVQDDLTVVMVLLREDEEF